MGNSRTILNFKRYILKEQETQVEDESTLEKILRSSPKIVYTLTKLLSYQGKPNDDALEDIRAAVADIRIILMKPTTFRVILKNNNYFDLKYDPTPMDLKYEREYEPSDSFVANVSGKKYFLVNDSEYEQCLDAIGIVMKELPIGPKDMADEEGGEDIPGGEAGEEPESAEEPAGEDENQ